MELSKEQLQHLSLGYLSLFQAEQSLEHLDPAVVHLLLLHVLALSNLLED